MPAGMKLRLRAVVTVGRPHGTDNRQMIHIACDMRKPIADFDTTFAMLLESDLQRVQRIPLIAVAIGDYQAFNRQFFWILHIGKRGFGNRLSRILIQHRLGIETFHVADSAIHEQPDHTFRPGGKMGHARWRCPAQLVSETIALQYAGQRNGCETISQKVSSCAHRCLWIEYHVYRVPCGGD